MFLDNENYKLLLIIPCKIENIAYSLATCNFSILVFFQVMAIYSHNLEGN